MMVDTFINFLYGYFFAFQEKVEKVGIFAILFGKLLGARGIILLQFNSISMGRYPSSLSLKRKERSQRTQPSKI